MRRSLFPLLLAMALAGCMGEPPPPPVAEYQPPPPPLRPLYPPLNRPKHVVVAASPSPRPAAVKEQKAAPKPRPLGQGTLTSVTVGDYMDGQEKELRAALHGAGIVVSRVGDSLVLNIPSDALFAASSDSVSGRGQTVLRAVADSAHKFDSTLLFVNGFTDTAVPHGQAMKETQKLADAVGKSLASNGVDPRRISAKGYGAENLKVPTGPNAKEPRNRRIEIDITPRMKA